MTRTAARRATTRTYLDRGQPHVRGALRPTRRRNVSNVDSYTWEVDITPPTIQINDKPNDPTNATSADFTFSAVAPNAEAGEFECKLDTPSTTGTFADCDSGTSGNQSYGGLNAEGAYTFTVKSTDAAGNTSDAKSTTSGRST